MRKQKVFFEHRGCLRGQGGTKAEAKADLAKQVDWACQYNPLHVETYLGHVIIIAPNSYGYSSMVIEPTAENKVHSFRTFIGREPIEREIKRQRLHVAQMCWTASDLAAHDEEFVETARLDDEGTIELTRWIAWQRLYTRHIDAGATSAQAHERACRGEPVKEAV